METCGNKRRPGRESQSAAANANVCVNYKDKMRTSSGDVCFFLGKRELFFFILMFLKGSDFTVKSEIKSDSIFR